MELFGMKFVPLNEPLEIRLQTFAAAFWFFIISFGGVTGAIVSFYLVLYTSLRWIILPYLLWIYLLDRHTAENGGRINPWIRSWVLWRYFKDYFPIQLIKLKGVELDPKKNYLIAGFPHGIIPAGLFGAFVSDFCGFREKFPHHERHMVTLSQQFLLPFCRELLLGLGAVSSSARSIDNVLSKPDGGNVLIISVGGAKEAFYCKPGTYRVVLKNRKGFVKLALKNGASLIPMFTFGETELYDQFDGPLLRKIQETLKRWIVIAPVLPKGRGFFQYSFGCIPRQHPLAVVVGHPIEVPKLEHPTEEEIDKYHSIFIDKLNALFEEHKFKYLDEPERKKLVID